jgi:signal peptidase II
VIGSLLRLNYTTNSGAAFNLGSNLTIVLTVFAMVVTVGLLVFTTKIAHSVWAIAIGTLLGGVLGNLSDRIFREPRFLHGHVVDFIQLPRWPIFNFADIAITISAAILAFLIFRNVEPFITFGQRRDEEAP